MTEIFLTHFARYPQMTPQDAVKLLYQSAFGPGHLIRDEGVALARLEQELEHTPADPAQPLLEDIGGGYARLHLAAAKGHNLPVSDIFARFLASAQANCPGKAAFEGGLSLLEALTAAGKAPFSPAALGAYLADYRAAGCPMVSHSEIYRTHYRPAYRVVRRNPHEMLHH